MKRKIYLSALIVFLASCGGGSDNSSRQNEKIEYQTYYNQRYDYAVDYPDFLIPQGESGNQDGQEFISKDGKNQMWVYWDAKMDIETGDSPSIVQAYNKDLQGKNVSEKEIYDNYYTFKGKLAEGKLFSQYTISDMGSFFTLWFEFVESDAAMFDAIIKHVSQSFNIGVGEGQGATANVEDSFLSLK